MTKKVVLFENRLTRIEKDGGIITIHRKRDNAFAIICNQNGGLHIDPGFQCEMTLFNAADINGGVTVKKSKE